MSKHQKGWTKVHSKKPCDFEEKADNSCYITCYITSLIESYKLTKGWMYENDPQD